jgi:hypothetical protein
MGSSVSGMPLFLQKSDSNRGGQFLSASDEAKALF